MSLTIGSITYKQISQHGSQDLVFKPQTVTNILTTKKNTQMAALAAGHCYLVWLPEAQFSAVFL
jgi:hypothetical protein